MKRMNLQYNKPRLTVTENHRTTVDDVDGNAMLHYRTLYYYYPHITRTVVLVVDQTRLDQQTYTSEQLPPNNTMAEVAADYDSALEGVLEDTSRLIIKQEVEIMEAAVQVR